MKLSPTQIAQIDETLVLNKVVYDDIKLELTDHIASDVEAIMVDKEISFEVAFNEAYEKWRTQLKTKTGFWNPEKSRFLFSKRDVAPRMVMDKLERISKKQFLNSILLAVIITFLALGIVKIYEGETVLKIIGKIYVFLCFILITLMMLGRILMFKIKGATTFGHLFKIGFFRTVWMPFFNLFILSTIFAFRSAPIQYAILFTLVTFGLVKSILSLSLLYKHFQFERKLKTV